VLRFFSRSSCDCPFRPCAFGNSPPSLMVFLPLYYSVLLLFPPHVFYSSFELFLFLGSTFESPSVNHFVGHGFPPFLPFFWEPLTRVSPHLFHPLQVFSLFCFFFWAYPPSLLSLIAARITLLWSGTLFQLSIILVFSPVIFHTTPPSF